MALNIVSPRNSFVQFSESDQITGCGIDGFSLCLPVLNDDDVNFQFIIQADSAGEADLLCSDDTNTNLDIFISTDCTGNGFVLNLTESGTYKTERSRVSPTQVLYNWSHGFPGFQTVIDVAQCFHVVIDITQYAQEYLWCSNCFQRITDGCFTSVVDYSGDDNQFGFDYCGGQAATDTQVDCEPLIITFANVATVTIPYTAFLQAKYGDVPTVSTWIYDESGDLVQAGLRESFDAFPPSVINIDLGGLASGIVKIS